MEKIIKLFLIIISSTVIYILGIYLFVFLYNFFMYEGLYLELQDITPKLFFSTSFLLLPILVFIEEVIFRLPITLIFKYSIPEYYKYFLVLLLSIFFGLFHLGFYDSDLWFLALLFQGFAGLMYSFVYIKSGGVNGRPFEGLIVSTLAHVIINVIFTFLVLRWIT